MKSLIFFPILLFLALFCHSQSNEIKIDYDYFLLGTLNDYMGREKYKEVVNRVDEYSQASKSLVLLIDSVYKDKYPDLTTATNIKTGRLELLSKLLSQKMNDFYSFNPSGRIAYSGDTDFKKLNIDSLMNTPGFYTTYFDTIFTGYIKGDIFKNDIERISFIAGAYIRFGGEKDSLCYISIANSVSKARIVSEQLKELECSNVEYVIKKGYIPVGHTVYFTPSDELKKYFMLLTRVGKVID